MQDATFNEKGRQTKTKSHFWENRRVAEDCSYVKGRGGEGFYGTWKPPECRSTGSKKHKIQGKTKYYSIGGIL